MERIFYKTELTDAYYGCPIYIFDTSYLPPPEEVDYDLFIPTIMQWLPRTPYVVILFSCGLNKINWVWGISFLKAFLSSGPPGVSNAENVQKIIAVHESWFVKSVSHFFTNFLVSKKTFAGLPSLLPSLTSSNDLLISCDTLSDLANYVDLTRLKISLNVYRHDYQTTMSPVIELHSLHESIITRSTQYSAQSDPLFFYHFYQIFNIIDAYACQSELLFHKPGKKTNTEILYHCITRNQVIWINDWDLHCVASCFKKILTEVHVPLVDTTKIVLPMKDDLDYTSTVFDTMMQEPTGNAVLFQIVNLCYKIVASGEVTRHTPLSISRSLSHALTHQSLSGSSKDSISIAVRYLKNLLNHWRDIYPRYHHQFKTVQQVADGEELADSAIDESYNMSFDMSARAVASSDEEENLDTKNVLSQSDDAKSHRVKSDSSVPRARSPEKMESSEPKEIQIGDLSLNSNSSRITEQKRNREKPQAPKSPPSRGEAATVAIPPQKTRAESIQIQFPPQKYKFERPMQEIALESGWERRASEEHTVAVKKPVIRGRKVGELTKIFEERTHALKILNTM